MYACMYMYVRMHAATFERNPVERGAPEYEASEPYGLTL